MSGLYEQLCNLFIKPARQTYSDHDLGPYALGPHAIRQNFSLTSHQGHEIKATLFKNKNKYCNTCIIYLHSFNGSRLQSLRYAADVVQKDFHFCCFDFPGCGNSGGEYVSLGCNQRWDVLKLIDKLRNQYGFNQFFIWGRSMGAVAAIKFYSLLTQEQSAGRFSDICIIGLVLDSAFISLKRMVVQVGRSRITVPEILIKAVFMMISSSIQEKAQFKIEDLELAQDIQLIRCSTLLVASKQDTFVNYSHSEDIFGKLKLHDNKEIQYTRGEHYQNRDAKTISNIYSFFQKKFKKYNDVMQRMNYLKQSRAYGIPQQIQDFSLEKHTKSLRKYEPKVASQKRPELNKYIGNEIKYASNTKIVLFRSNVEDTDPKCMQSTEFRSVGSDKKIPMKGNQVMDKQYQTEKRIQPHIKIVIASNNKEGKHKNELRSKSKPNFICRIGQVCHTRQFKDQQELNKSTERTLEATENQENHCNIITDKLRKKGKNLREKIFEFKDRNEDDQPHRVDNQRTKTKISFTIGNMASTPVHSSHPQQKSKKKLSMTAQQYKNSQIKIIKGVVTLSPNIKRRTDKGSCTDLKQKMQEQSKPFQQSKSANNLISLLGHDRPDTRSYKNMSSMLHIQPTLKKP